MTKLSIFLMKKYFLHSSSGLLCVCCIRPYIVAFVHNFNWPPLGLCAAECLWRNLYIYINILCFVLCICSRVCCFDIVVPFSIVFSFNFFSIFFCHFLFVFPKTQKYTTIVRCKNKNKCRCEVSPKTRSQRKGKRDRNEETRNGRKNEKEI